MSLKNPVTPPGIDPGTVRLVAQRLNHYATPGPLTTSDSGLIRETSVYRIFSLSIYKVFPSICKLIQLQYLKTGHYLFVRNTGCPDIRYTRRIIYMSNCFHYTNTRLPTLQSKIPEYFFRLLSTLVDVNVGTPDGTINVGTPDGTINNQMMTRPLSTCFEAYCHRSQYECFQLSTSLFLIR
jgi:hypothetical protein